MSQLRFLRDISEKFGWEDSPTRKFFNALNETPKMSLFLLIFPGIDLLSQHYAILKCLKTL